MNGATPEADGEEYVQMSVAMSSDPTYSEIGARVEENPLSIKENEAYDSTALSPN